MTDRYDLLLLFHKWELSVGFLCYDCNLICCNYNSVSFVCWGYKYIFLKDVERFFRSVVECFFVVRLLWRHLVV